jgi:hypothetical protein
MSALVITHFDSSGMTQCAHPGFVRDYAWSQPSSSPFQFTWFPEGPTACLKRLHKHQLTQLPYYLRHYINLAAYRIMSNGYSGTGAPTYQNDNGTTEDKGNDHAALVNQNISGAIFLVVMVRLRQARHSTPSTHTFAFVRPPLQP